MQLHSRQHISPRGLRATLGGTAAALTLLLSAGLLTMAPQAAQAQAANGATFTTLHVFTSSSSTDGQEPYGALTLGPDGNYYGTTFDGGANGDGTVYKMTPSGTESVIYSFAGGSADGSTPYSGLVLGSDGNFYGTTGVGGSSSDGTIFQITPSGTETVLHNFTGADGKTPQCALVVGPDGSLYGTAQQGGTNNLGTIYKITLSGTFTLLFQADRTNGRDLTSALVLGSDGNFYGVATNGGPSVDGAVFQMTPAGALTTLYSFSDTDGDDPFSSLVEGSDGSFYGATAYGGPSDDGIIFKVTSSGALTTLHSGSGDGAGVTCPLLLGTDGNFYGMGGGGPNNTGVIFQLTPGGTLTTLYSFSADDSSNTDGAYPGANDLTEAADGTLYGNVENGGIDDAGTIFKMTVPSLTASVNPPPTAPPAPTVTGSGVRFDFNGDGKADLLWFNTASNALSIFDMNDTSVVSLGNTFAGPAPGSGWQPVASVDVNGDGFPDLIWWNNQTGELSDWTMDGNALIQANADFDTVPDTNWKPVAAADVVDNTSGNPPAWELVFQNTATGEISRWSMSGTTVVNYGGDLSTLGAGSPWQIVGAPDIDGDGKSDLLFWNNSTGEVSYWSTDLADSRVLSFNDDITQVANTDWHLVGSEDTNGDGHSDLLWWNASTGELSRWLMNGTTVTSFGGDELQVSDTTWQPTAIR